MILECARRMSTFISCAFREHEDDQAAHPFLPSFLVISRWMGAVDLPLRAPFSPALPSDCIAIDFPGRAISPSEGRPILYFSMRLFRGVAEAALYCAHRATTALSWGLYEQEGHLAAPHFFIVG